MKKSKLQQHYEDALQYEIATMLDSEFLQKKYELTEFGASCVMNMMNRGEYCPELEGRYTEEGSHAGEVDDDIRFIKDMPPYSRFKICGSDLSLADKESYIAQGFAEWITLEDQRHLLIELIVKSSRMLNQHLADVREAISQRDSDFIREYFIDYNEEKIVDYMKEFEYTEDEINTVLEIVS